MKFIFKYLKPFTKTITFGLIIKLLSTILELVIPGILGFILDSVINSDGGIDVNIIVFWGGLMVLFSALALLFNVTANRMASRVARDASRIIRYDLFERTMTLSGRQTDFFTIPSLEARLTTDTYNVHHFIGMIQRIGVKAPMQLIGGIAITLFLDANLSLIMIALLPFICLIAYFVSVKGVPLYQRVQNSVDGMVRVVREDTQGIRVIKALSKVEYENQRYDKVNKQLLKDEKRATLTMGVVNPVMNLLMNLGITFVVLLGAYRVSDGLSKPGNIVSFTQYFTMISMSMMAVTRVFVMITKSSASAKRIQEVVEAPTDLQVCSINQFPIKQEDGFIVFDNVCFSYNNTKNNLTNISFSLPRGGMLGIIGSTGSGKTTIINLLMRFYDVNSGSVRIDGQDVRTIDLDRLHTMFGVALQNDFLYADTVEENVRFGRDISHEQVVKACKIAQADEFIGQFEEGYKHRLSQKGTNISGGQKQRLLIARAIANNPEILILDDSSSALDYKTDANVRQAIKANFKNTTSVVVAQRVSSVMGCDLILVLEEGEVIGAGTHEKLIENCSVYREISLSQMGGDFDE